MLVLPLIVMFLVVFVVGLVRDWRSDVLDEPRRGGLVSLLMPAMAAWRAAVAAGETMGELFGRARPRGRSGAPYQPYPLESAVAAGDNAIDISAAAGPS